MPSEVKVKICGITHIEDARLAIDLGAWAIGFIFYPKSPRYVHPLQAGEILSQLTREEKSQVKSIGVFVNPTLSEVNQFSEQMGVQMIQLHGNESKEICKKLQSPVIKAFRPLNKLELRQMGSYRNLDSILIDAFVPGRFGGTGVLSNWHLAKLAKKYNRVILSGGLTAENVGQAVSVVNPYAVDVSSGVEKYPGRKCVRKMEKFFKEVRQ